MPEVTFIWKYENPHDELLKGIDNLVLTEWMPQNELLGRIPNLNLNLVLSDF